MEIVSSCAGKGSDSSVDYRELPLVSVVYLCGAGKDGGTYEHGSYPHLILMCKTIEQLFEGEKLVCGIRYGSRIRCIGLAERFFLELRSAPDRESDKADDYNRYVFY